MSILRAPPRTLITIVKNAPKKVTKAIDISLVGQNISDAGTHASGGMGLRISNGGKKTPRKYRLTANNRPNGIPIIIATRKPVMTRLKLATQLIQYPCNGMTSRKAAKTCPGGGTRPMPSKSYPVHSSSCDPMCQRITKIMIAPIPRRVVVLVRSFCKKFVIVASVVFPIDPQRELPCFLIS